MEIDRIFLVNLPVWMSLRKVYESVTLRRVQWLFGFIEMAGINLETIFIKSLLRDKL